MGAESSKDCLYLFIYNHLCLCIYTCIGVVGLRKSRTKILNFLHAFFYKIFQYTFLYPLYKTELIKKK